MCFRAQDVVPSLVKNEVVYRTPDGGEYYIYIHTCYKHISYML